MTEAVSDALAAKTGRDEARQIVEDATAKALSTKRNLQDLLGEDERVKRHFTVGELAKLFEPMAYQGVAQTLVDRIVGQLQGRATKR
jgi:3-carboxy-cis,cis-muconate cycloisomerase